MSGQTIKNEQTIKDLIDAVMKIPPDKRPFPSDTYISCGGGCGRLGCIGNCIIEAWRRHFQKEIDDKL